MKTLLLLLLISPLISSAQDSCQLKRETDQFTHETRITTGFIPFNVSGIPLSISVDATKAEIDFFLWIRNDSKCFDENSTIQLIFEGDKLKSNFKNTGSMNCEGAFHFTFRNSKSTATQLKRMTEKRINSIKLTGNDKSVTEISFSEEQKQMLLKMATCVATQAKTLL
jgi:hypothetical protein